MRDFKRLMTEQGEDLFHKNMRRFGATVRESHKAYKDIKYGRIYFYILSFKFAKF